MAHADLWMSSTRPATNGCSTEGVIMTTIYTPTERAFLCDYFQIDRPDELALIDVRVPADGIYVEDSGSGEDIDLSNAVARLGLQRVQDRLPAWTSIDSSGEFLEARRYFEAKERGVELMPQLLFTINWADSGPGFSWPEAYHLIWFPEFDRYVVTGSQDSTDVYGVEDVALGYASFSEDWYQVSRDILVKNWREEHSVYIDEGWLEVLDPGFVPKQMAEGWRDEVWPEPQEDLDDE